MRKAILFIVVFLGYINIGYCKDSFTLDSLKAQYVKGHESGNPALVQGAVDGCKQLIDLYENRNDIKSLAKCYTLLGQIFVEYGSAGKANEVLLKAYSTSLKVLGAEAYETLEAKKYLSWSYGYLGDLDMELKFSQELLQSYLKQKSKYYLDITDLYNTIGMNYGLRNQRETERVYYEVGRKMLEEFRARNSDEQFKVQTQLANLYNSISLSYIGSIDYRNALAAAKKSLAYSEKLNSNNPERAPVLVVVGRCLYILEKKCDSAIYYFDKAIQLLEANNLKGSPMWLSYQSYKMNIMARCGNGEQAKVVGQSTIKSLVDNGESTNDVLNKLLVLSQQTADAEITTMESQFKEREAAALQKSLKERYMYLSVISLMIMVAIGVFAYIKNRQKAKAIDFQKKELQFQQTLLQQRDEIRTRISKDMHDEIGAGLTNISMVCMQAEMDLKKEVIIGKPFLDRIHQRSITLSENLKELIWATKPENDNLSSLITEIRTYTYQFLENSEINLSLRLPEIDSYATNPETNRNIYLIIKEALNNAAKYSSASAIEIDFNASADGVFQLTISDNGTGFDTTTEVAGNGLGNMKIRATSIKNGQFTLQSSIGSGTQILVSGNLS